MHKSILALILAISFFPAKAMKVALDGEFLAIESRLEGCHSIRYEFSRCMANHIYTFSRVLVDSVVVNEATSDNIGPFLIENSGWTGGNHLLPDGSPSARTDSISIHTRGANGWATAFVAMRSASPYAWSTLFSTHWNPTRSSARKPFATASAATVYKSAPRTATSTSIPLKSADITACSQ